jgi:hypothetical protein
MSYPQSTSKLIFRDPMAPGAKRRISSEEAVNFEWLLAHWPLAPIFISVSIRVRMAERNLVSQREDAGCWGMHGHLRQVFFGAKPSLPAGISAVNLAMLTVWFLGGEARRLPKRLSTAAKS